MYTNLKAWQDSRVLAKQIDEITETFPKREHFGVAAQLRRAAVSIPSNIAEGESRWSFRDQCRFYDIARRSLIETETQLILAADLGFTDQETIDAVLRSTAEIGREINGLIRSARNCRSGI